ncbi:MAG TPA: TraB/GumN family protein [Hellea balneolensis]|uniref:TraB/GumN family protein n=1 Tax=Hellea balneolensis TaxID=287478 RepID=A0A7V5NWD5_9PROT|nr:TraB/GumN family protein [Hellea balneolensis]
MRMKKFFTAMFGLAFALLVAWALTKQGGSVKEMVELEHKRFDAPALWKVTDKDSTLYLFGTVHLLPEDMKWQKRDMLAAFDEAGTVFFESPDDTKAAFKTKVLQRQYGLYGSGEQLNHHLDRVNINRLTAAALNTNVPLGSLVRFKPWLVSDLLTTAAAEQAGLSYENSADNWLRQKARKQHKHIEALDGVETYFKAVAQQPESVQLRSLKKTLNNFDQLVPDLKTVNAAWLVGNTALLEDELLKPFQQRSPEIFSALIVNRNADWARKLDAFMQKDDDAFVAVGIAHMLGEDGLPARLAEMGYKVERVRRTDLPNEK